MKITTTLFAGAAAFGMAAAANAAVVPLDDFATAFTGQPVFTAGPEISTGPQAITVGVENYTRTASLVVDNNENGDPSGAQFRTDGGNFIYSSDTGVAGIVTLEYQIGSALFDAQTGAASGSIRILEISADRPRTYQFSINGVLQDTNVVLVDTELGFPVVYALNFDTAILTGDDTIELVIDAGAEGQSLGDALDLEISILDIEIPERPPEVPAPGALGLLGLGILGLGMARRRKA
ncbi:PEP-CTERM sorting domain-containing protein [Pacificimonas sp. WHA3]|uniref:PEP-CTERM sorting domain-containing protein n=1 Tax=Pacificimonas pallii TaxID=2827236 RepID=A0ABS6SHQ6_9SPHN|nr:PEP-CTERM sorting domain-containing protein [Pacificimonas pallii]MBV7257947.1 PEP-CTERM sorting domain-containing protein [Pacificimonas pallii]